ncbi:MAG: hypothetical protein AVDCRST_MAG41-342 [uncultured Corynebacteriales bacterium]|uniref:Uncharacterized protein n=1 Tax=uncultured Mycobacteriales bacterium TaxID=581187 RepID=A0A6J4H843_9ACTN|nr:MAG: hypothetical protein AVDCRST_MAG41-342 [uncultured Corynebacteriales bacterium]
MSPRSLFRPVAALAAVTLAVGLVATLSAQPRAAALPRPLSLLSGLEQVVGAISPTVLAQLPADPRLYGPYSSRPTPASCPDGADSCVRRTIADMTARFDRLAPRCDHDAVFSLLYLRVTERYRDLAAPGVGYFGNPALVNQEDRVFYDLYAGSYADWHAGRPGTVPPIWRLTYAAADARQVLGSGDLLLAMAAHILRDLPFALWRIGMGDRADHLAVNAMLRSVYTEVVDELARRFDPLIRSADTLPGSDVLVVTALAQWRDKAWLNGQELVAAGSDPVRFRAVADRIEAESWAVGLNLYLATRYPVQSLTVTRDAYCAQNWNART